jgi:hypothetical protein
MAMLWSSKVPNLTEVLTNFLEVAAGFPEWVAVAGLPGSLVTEGKTAATAATLTVVAGIAELGQNLWFANCGCQKFGRNWLGIEDVMLTSAFSC